MSTTVIALNVNAASVLQFSQIRITLYRTVKVQRNASYFTLVLLTGTQEAEEYNVMHNLLINIWLINNYIHFTVCVHKKKKISLPVSSLPYSVSDRLVGKA